MLVMKEKREVTTVSSTNLEGVSPGKSEREEQNNPYQKRAGRLICTPGQANIVNKGDAGQVDHADKGVLDHAHGAGGGYPRTSQQG